MVGRSLPNMYFMHAATSIEQLFGQLKRVEHPLQAVFVHPLRELCVE